MAKLALAVGESILLGGDLVLRLDRRAAEAAAKAGGGDVLLYQLVPGSFVRVLGRGRVAGLVFGAEGEPIKCRLDNVRPFAMPVTSESEAALPRVRSMLSLSEERFAEFVARSAEADTEVVSAEADVGFKPDTGIYQAIHRQVLQRWDFRCAITGERYEGATVAHPQLRVVAIRPRDRGGPLHVRNYLPMIEEAARAWERGDMSVADDLKIGFVIDRAPPELLRRLPSGFRLIVPDDPELRPDPEHLAYHRQHIFGA